MSLLIFKVLIIYIEREKRIIIAYYNNHNNIRQYEKMTLGIHVSKNSKLNEIGKR